MRTSRGTTLVELMVASTILLLMVTMTSGALVSYGRAYHQYTDKSLRVRQAARVLEVVCQHLRSARTLRTPELEHGFACGPTPFVFVERGGILRALVLSDGLLELQELDLQEKKLSAIRLGKARGLKLLEQTRGRARYLHLTLDVEGAPPLETSISLRGVQRGMMP